MIPTRTTRFFLDRYKAATVRGAVERAAGTFRSSLLGADHASVPVDVERLAERVRIRFGDDLGRDCEQDARLQATANGFVVRFRACLTPGQRRFALAHEIGHTLFYDGQRHQIGVRAQREFEAEEKICNRFASALLMPAETTLGLVSPLRVGTPWGIIRDLETQSRRLRVSLPALITRIGSLGVSSAPAMIPVFRWQRSRKTGEDPQLRLWIRCELGTARTAWIWWNRTARGVGLHHAARLFGSWRTSFPNREQTSGGRFCWHPTEGLVRASENSVSWQQETIEVATRTWKTMNKSVRVSTAHYLYAPPGAEMTRVYVVSLVTFPGFKWTFPCTSANEIT